MNKHSTRRLKGSKSKSIDVEEYTAQDLPSLRRKRTMSYNRLVKALEIGTVALSDSSKRDLFLSYYRDIKTIAHNFEHAHLIILDILDDPEDVDNKMQERNIKQWPEYYDTFNALIHNSTTLTDTEKFHYLVSSLSGEALTVVKTFPKTQDHYHDAYQTLTLDFPVQHWDFVLVYHILSKIDPEVRQSLEEKYSDVEIPSFDQVKSFLRAKSEALIRGTHFTATTKLKSNQTAPAVVTSQSRRTPAATVLAASLDIKQTTQPYKCAYCDESHSITSCPTFLKKSVDERINVAHEKKWCYNCLKSSHQLKDCKSIFTCRTCKRKHHTLLHRERPQPQEPNPTVSALISKSHLNTTVLLATAIVQVRDASGRMQSFRALFDTGSQSNFITESAVKSLGFTPAKVDTKVSGLGEAMAPISGDVTCSVGTSTRVYYKLNMHVIKKICGDQPIAQLNTSGWSHIKSLTLADPGFDIPGPIDLLLAADVFVESILNQRIKGGYNQPTAFNSIYGWLLLVIDVQCSISLQQRNADPI
ncbi:hypothetical protein HW555_006097 [Spodoptera exigua]|uniref:Peptidase aspartic putative domain-containing protein n=1 Tax=Spodoptera exigua TaxID=7107 RepID=A0A835GIK4_SPOEX|nr:hypothetical protein HW555_006097 [Spodoptera exigua]